MKRYFTYVFLCCVSLLFSCVGKKKFLYIQNPSFYSTNPTVVETQPNTYKLQVGDIISVQIKDATGRASEQLSLQTGGGNPFLAPNEMMMYLNGYTIDKQGNISVPALGKVSIEGLTIQEVEAKLYILVNEYYKNPTVIIRLTSFRVSVLGEVRFPGRHLMPTEQVSILDAIAICGDLTENASRRVRLFRKSGNQKIVLLIDLKDPNLISSPYFYLQPNDMIIVDRLGARLDRDNLGLFGNILTAITSVMLIWSFILQNSK
jgi:polysaccharide biosynthesis/export protein